MSCQALLYKIITAFQKVTGVGTKISACINMDKRGKVISSISSLSTGIKVNKRKQENY